MNIQNEFSKINGRFFALPSAECEGPLLIDRDGITIEGHGGTLWAENGPVLKIVSDNVTIKNIRLDVIQSEEIALADCGKNTKFVSVEIHGQIEGEKESGWKIPKQIDLGHFAAEAENRFYIHLSVPQDTKITSHIEGVRIFPAVVRQNTNEIMIVSEKLFKGTIIYGDLLLSSKGIIRCIKVAGEAEEGAPIRQDIPSMKNIKKEIQIIEEKKDLTQNSPVSSIMVPVIRGQRLIIPNDEKLYIRYTDDRHPSGMDIDFYVFALNKARKVNDDEDLIFFGNTISVDKAIQIQQDRTVEIIPSLAKKERFVVCCAIYEDSHISFAQVEHPVIKIDLSGKTYVFSLDGLQKETTVNVLEVYLYKDIWKIKFVGAGYADGLRHLCENYGLTVED